MLVFERVRYRSAQTQQIAVTNCGKVFVHFRVMDEEQLRLISNAGMGVMGGGQAAGAAARGKDWLTVEPPFGLLMPGESRRLLVTVDVRDAAARNLRHGVSALERVLALQVEGGNTLFLSVRASVLPTAHGRSIEALAASAFPVRSAPVTRVPGARTAERRLSAGTTIPREIWRLTGALHERLPRGGREERVFVASGDAAELREIRECLDTGTPFGEHLHARSMAEALLQLLRSLAVPVIPPAVHRACIKSFQAPDKVWTALESLPPSHLAVLVYLTAFLRELLRQNPPDLSAETLALVWGYVLMLPDVEVLDADPDDVVPDREGGGGVGGGSFVYARGGQDTVYVTKEQAVVMHLLRGKDS